MFAPLSALLLLLGFAAAPRPAAAPVRQALDDATIIAVFDAANSFDIETGTLGSTKGASKEVRAVGVSLVRDHEAVRQQGRDLAKRLGVTPTLPKQNPLGPQHVAALKDLKAKQGAAFDMAFLDHEIAYHQAVIDAVTKSFLPAIKNPELKAFVEKVAPAFQAHLDMVKAARAQLANHG